MRVLRRCSMAGEVEPAELDFNFEAQGNGHDPSSSREIRPERSGTGNPSTSNEIEGWD